MLITLGYNGPINTVRARFARLTTFGNACLHELYGLAHMSVHIRLYTGKFTRMRVIAAACIGSTHRLSSAKYFLDIGGQCAEVLVAIGLFQ